MGRLREMSGNGDDETPWSIDNPASVSAAAAIFEAKRRAGFAAFAKIGNGKHELVKVFDPKADEILIVRQGTGG